MFSALLDSGFLGVNEMGALGQTINGLPFVTVTTSDAGPQLGADLSDINPITNSQDFFEGLWAILSWDHSFLQGTLFGFPLVILRWVGLCVSMGFMIPLAFMLVNMAKSILNIIP